MNLEELNDKLDYILDQAAGDFYADRETCFAYFKGDGSCGIMAGYQIYERFESVEDFEYFVNQY